MKRLLGLAFLALMAVWATMLAALGQTLIPAGTVPAYATIATDLKGTSQHSGRVLKHDCHGKVPPFWRPDTGWVRTSYTCGR